MSTTFHGALSPERNEAASIPFEPSAADDRLLYTRASNNVSLNS